ncbi:MAG: class I SAM-dependent methyltransferase [Nocardioidaceae bacterium]|nr:class I SAM-dependent methyltransferase [Nocardioidaceae bacterium]MCL2613764.1 class I SAM-dependent methyltransferase [Nocardioidaceae bacterium]
MTQSETAPTPEPVDFDGIRIAWDDRVLRPRPWTAEQSRWAAELAAYLPEGPILELCAGAGHIGLLAARLSGRRIVQVDRDPVAVEHARANAGAAGIETDLRCSSLDTALAPDESFPLVLADPPWLTSEELADFPADPVDAVDGGPDGTALIAECLRVALAHLHPDGHLVLQVGRPAQAAWVAERLRAAYDGWVVADLRDCRPGGVLVDVARG